MKKVLALVMALCMVFALCAVSASADEPVTLTYAEVQCADRHSGRRCARF